MKKWIFFYCSLMSITFAFTSFSEAQQEISYYGENFYFKINQNLQEQDLKQELFNILSNSHILRKNQKDRIVIHCPQNKRCYRHIAHSYRNARRFMFGDLDLQKTHNGDYALTDVYCQKTYKSSDFKNKPFGPEKIPDNRYINAEHTWPQSQFSNKQPKHLQKVDLHAIFPSGSYVNSQRGNYPFGEVKKLSHKTCLGTKLGYIRGKKGRFFEPPDQHKGNVARALFYFSVRYQTPITFDQEAFLKKWHKQDPVDQTEHERNNNIFEFQRTRNPFIDHPELVDYISNF